jgi:hypothetical protein
MEEGAGEGNGEFITLTLLYAGTASDLRRLQFRKMEHIEEAPLVAV